MSDSIVIYPLLKKDKKGVLDSENISNEEIDKLTDHYIEQLILLCNHHGIKMDDNFYSDFNLICESFKSMLLRAVGKYHKLQDFVDSMEEINKK